MREPTGHPWSIWRRVRMRSVAVADLSHADVEALWGLASRLIDRERDEFEATLRRCERAYVVRDGHRVVGLGASQTFAGRVGGRPARVLEAKWGWLLPEVRGAHLGAAMALWAIADTRLRHPREPLYGLLTAATEPSFLMVHRYCAPAWPHPDRETPADLAALMDAALRHHLGDGWDPGRGVIRGRGVYRYRVPQRRSRSDPAAQRLVDFYHARNPGQADGDCLPMIFPFDLPQVAGIVRKMLRGPRPAGLGARPVRADGSGRGGLAVRSRPRPSTSRTSGRLGR